MIRIGRLTDYGVVLMSYMAAHRTQTHNATEVAAGAHLPQPTVSKLMKVLAREGLLVSHRGAKGGYDLARPPEGISMADIISALEGPVALTVCTSQPSGDCEYETRCPVRGHWLTINRAIRQALDGVTLATMVAERSPGPLPVAEASGGARAPLAAMALPR